MKYRLVTFNTWMLTVPFVGARDVKARLALLPSRLSALDADMVCLQEVWHPKIARELAIRLSDNGYAYTFWDKKSLRNGLMILSRQPFGEVRHLHHDVRARGWERFLSKAVIWFDLTLAGQQVRIVNAHLGAEISSEQRIHQIRRLANNIWEDYDGPIIVAGDLNFDPLLDSKEKLSAEYALMTQEFGFVDSLPRQGLKRVETLGRENQYVTGNWRGKSVDYVMYRGFTEGDSITARVVLSEPIQLSCGRKIFLSDHYGVCATFGD